MNRTQVARRSLVFALALAAAGCGGLQATQTIPLLPGDGDDNTEKPRPIVGDQDDDGPWSDPASLIAAPEPRSASALELPTVERFTLRNGLEVVLVVDRSAPVTSFQLAVKAGRDVGTREKTGLARLTAVMLTRGTRTRSAKAIADRIGAAGGDLSADASYEASLISCNAVSSDARACSDTLADMVRNPTFPGKAFIELREQLKNAINQRVRDATSLASVHFQNALWGKDHPRGWPTSGRTLESIKRDDVVGWHRRWYRPNNSILAVSGDFDAKAMRTIVERAFAGWGKAKLPARKVATIAAPKGIRVRLVDKPDEKVAHLRIGHIGVAHGADDFFPTLVLSNVLGGVPDGSRLEQVLAGGMAIRASSNLDRQRQTGSLLISASAPASEAVRVAQKVRDAISRLRADGPTEEEVRRAASFVAGGYATRFQSISDLAGAILAARLHGLDEKYVANYPVRATAVPPGEVTRAATAHLTPNDIVIVFVGPAAVIGPQLNKAGWKFDVTSYIDPVAEWERESVVAEANKILAEALAAKGGKKLLTQLKTFAWKGKATLRTGAAPMGANVEKRFSSPDQLRLDMNIPSQKVTISTIMSGNVGWALQVSPQGSQSIAFPQAEVAAGRAQIWRDQDFVLLRHLEKDAEVAVVDTVQIDGKANWAVRVISSNKQYSVVLYVDKATKLLSGMTYQERAPNGKVLVAEERYSNYKRIDGLQIAHKRTTRSAQVDLTTVVESVRINKPIDAKIYVKPAK